MLEKRTGQGFMRFQEVHHCKRLSTIGFNKMENIPRLWLLWLKFAFENTYTLLHSSKIEHKT
jgi:hypothetical protein